MSKGKILILIAVIFILVSSVVFVGYLRKKSQPEGPKTAEVEKEGEIKPSPLPIKETQPPLPIISPTPIIQPETTSTLPRFYKSLFNNPLLYLDLDYPLLYIYDPQEGIIKYLDLENEIYKEIYKIYDLKDVHISPDKLKIILETNSGLFLLDLKSDTLKRLPILTKNFAFTSQDLIIYINNESNLSYLAYFRDGKIEKIRNLGILEPEIVSLKDSLLLYEKNSPVFLLNLKSPEILKIFLETKEEYSLLPNKSQNLVFVSFKDKNWQSMVMDLNKKIKISFSWGTAKEKCSFDDVLVCAIPYNLGDFSLEDWKLFKPNYDEKLIIYNPTNNQLKEINLEEKFDIVRPKLTPLGLIFWNRLDAKFYLIETEKLSL